MYQRLILGDLAHPFATAFLGQLFLRHSAVKKVKTLSTPGQSEVDLLCYVSVRSTVRDEIRLLRVKFEFEQ